MKIGVISADIASESRAAITPDTVKNCVRLGLKLSSNQLQVKQSIMLMNCIRQPVLALLVVAPR